ncbi:MAG: glycosyltransferase family 4 protein [Sedimentisphaerales bacterium]
MKIVYLSESLIPSTAANSIHVMKMCKAFSEQGCKLVLLVPKVGNPEESDYDLFEFYGVAPSFTLVRVDKIPLLGPSISYGIKCYRHLSRIRPDVVFSRSFLGSLSAVYAGFPTVYEFHQPISDFGLRQTILFRQLIKNRYFLGFVVVTKALKDWYINNFQLPQEKVLVAADGADLPLSSYDLREDIDLPDIAAAGHHVAYVGALYEGKGMEIVLPLAHSCPDVNFHIVGGRGQDIEHWKAKAVGQKNIFFHGFYPHAQVFSIMKKMDVLLAPNLTSMKGYGGINDIGKWTSPLKLFEYMAAKKPILASNIEVLREVLVHEKNSILCDPDDNEAWQAGLRRLLSDRELADQLTSKAFADLTEKYTWSKRAEALLAFIKSRL